MARRLALGKGDKAHLALNGARARSYQGVGRDAGHDSVFPGKHA